MSGSTQAVVLNALPLLVVAALYLVVTGSLAPSYWRERPRLGQLEAALVLMFPLVGLALGILGGETLVDREPLGGHAVVGLIAILACAVPPLVFLLNWSERALPLTSQARAREAEARSSDRERELGAVARLSRSLLGATDSGTVGALLVEEAQAALAVHVAALGVVDEEAGEARMVHGIEDGQRMDWLIGSTVQLSGEPSGLASAVAAREAFAVVDATTSPRVNRRLVERSGVRSVAFVPLLAGDRVPGVLVVGSTTPRVFTFEELELLQALAAEAALALEQLRSADALREALARERLIARIALDLRSELDLEAVLEVAVREVGRALELSRCYIRLDGNMATEWRAEGFEPVGERSTQLTVANEAEQKGRTVAYGNVEAQLEGVGLDVLRELGTRSVMATPIDVHGQRLGVLGLHRPRSGPWNEGAIALAEAVAREAGLGIRTARLLAENQRRLAEQTALLDASQALASELHFDAVIRRIVEEVSRLVGADAADCWILEDGGRRLRCLAVRGLPASEVGRTIAPEGTVAHAIDAGQPVLKRRFAETEQPAPTQNYAVFAEVMEAPIRAGGEVRGVLGVCSIEHDRFADSDLRLLEAFARLAGVALRNAEAFEEAARQARVQRGFVRIASVLGEPLSAAATLDAVAQAAAEALGGVSAAVLKPVGRELEPVGSYELRESMRSALERSSSVAALRLASSERHVLAAPQLAVDDRFAAWRSAVAEAGARALLAVPVEEPRGQRGGLVVVFFPEERSFTDDDLELARQVAVAARGALERSEVYELERRSRAHAQQLAETSRRLARELDPALVLDELAHEVTALLEADGASVRLLEGEELVVHGAVGPGSAATLGRRAPSTGWVVGDIAQSREAAAITDVATDERHLDADPMLAAGGYRAYLGVPLIGPAGGVHGLLAALSLQPREWRPEEVDAMLALAGAASAALSNAELYQQVAVEKGQSEAILANVADGIVAVDREGRVVLWNSAAERITGVPATEALGRSPAEALGRELAGADQVGAPGRLLPIRRGTDEVWLSLSEAVMHDPSGGVAGRIFAFRDISDELRVEQVKTTFVSTVSHELRTPLTSIYGFAETLLREDVQFGEEERRTFLRYIASESERLTTIVDTLLAVAQLEQEEFPVRVATTDVRSVVADAVRTVESALGGDGHHFFADVPDEPLPAEADGDKLRQVLAILLDNAVRYSPEGGKVVVAARRTEEGVEVRVEDEGIGITPAERENVFKKFYRGERAAAAVGTGNTGLGLFIAEGLVGAMGGTIRVESTEGKGSTFTLGLPAARTEPERVGV